MNLGLRGKVALVTGGVSGIGRAIAIGFGQEGANVVIADIAPDVGGGVANEINKLGVEVIVIKSDVSKEEDTIQMAEVAFKEFGRIDILVNNAAVWSVKPFQDTTKSDWNKEIGVCLYGTLNCTRAVLNHMMREESGRIINIASDAARIGGHNQGAYCAAKAGIIGFTKDLAKEVGRYNITVNAISPAATRTERVSRDFKLDDPEVMKEWVRAYPLGKIGVPEDLANMVVFIASERANHVTGQTISVNGGYCML